MIGIPINKRDITIIPCSCIFKPQGSCVERSPCVGFSYLSQQSWILLEIYSLEVCLIRWSVFLLTGDHPSKVWSRVQSFVLGPILDNFLNRWWTCDNWTWWWQDLRPEKLLLLEIPHITTQGNNSIFCLRTVADWRKPVHDLINVIKIPISFMLKIKIVWWLDYRSQIDINLFSFARTEHIEPFQCMSWEKTSRHNWYGFSTAVCNLNQMGTFLLGNM